MWVKKLNNVQICCHVLEWKYSYIPLKDLFQEVLKKIRPSFYFQSKDGQKELVCFHSEKDFFLQEVPDVMRFLSKGVFFVGLISFDTTQSTLFIPQFVVERNGQQMYGKIFVKQNVSLECLQLLIKNFEKWMDIFTTEILIKKQSLQEDVLKQKCIQNELIKIDKNPSFSISWGDLFVVEKPNQSSEDFSGQKNYKKWIDSIVQSQKKIARGTLEKVVLSCHRNGTITGLLDKDSWSISDIFQDFFRHSIKTYQMSLCLTESDTVFSASPETLCTVKNGLVYTESLAGSCPVGLGEEFLQDLKIQKENDIVAVFIRNTLAKYCTKIKQSSLHSVSLGYIQHARCTITSVLMKETNYWDLVQELHPTPAVCGSPREAAKQFIQMHENSPRGWYAGFCGIFYEDACDVFVNIRMIHVQNDVVQQFAGVGITLESICDAEIQEFKQKIRYWPR